MEELLFAGAVLLCFAFLTVVFGDRLSLIDGRWLTAPLDLLQWFWSMVCQLADRIWCFVFDHFWWVTAAASGAAGLVLIAFMLATGLSEQAAAKRRAIAQPLNAGGVLDHTPIVRSDTVVPPPYSVVSTDAEHILYQTPSMTDPVWRDNRRVITDLHDARSVPEVTDVPPLESFSPGPLLEKPVSRSRLMLRMEPFVERRGRSVLAQSVAELVRRSLFELRRDDWRTTSLAARMQRLGDSSDLRPLPQDPPFAAEKLRPRVRLIPGDEVAESDLLVQKQIPETLSGDHFLITIRIQNRSENHINGLIVRELLPLQWKVVEMRPEGVYSEDVVTWLVDDLLPLEERLLTLKVLSEETGSFQSVTEVSATTAVTSLTPIRSRRPPETNPLPPISVRPEPTAPTPPPARKLPPVAGIPDVRLRLVQEPLPTVVNRNVDVLFEVSNVGDAPARGVTLRVFLPEGLDHHVFARGERKPFVDSRIAELAVGESRELRLTVMPRTPGIHNAAAELRLKDLRLDRQRFDVVAREQPSAPREPDAETDDGRLFTPDVP